MRECTCIPPYAVSNQNTEMIRKSNNRDTSWRRIWPCPITDSCDDDWTWNIDDRSHETKLSGPRSRCVIFHPGWSNGTAAIRGTKPLLAPFQKGSQTYYWEIDLSHRVFGTSLMFGIGTRRADLHEYSYTNLLGKDCHSWALNHKGQIWHHGLASNFTQPFLENMPATIGLLLDWTRDDGVLEYYKDGKYLGTAFRQLSLSLSNNPEDCDSYLYPMIASTAARTEMCLVSAKRRFTSLQDRCVWRIAKSLRSKSTDANALATNVKQLDLPESLKSCIRKRTLAIF